MSIYTCTMNLAIDLFIETEKMEPRAVNRTIRDEAIPNGKGVNVSIILKKLDIENTALGFSGGFTGQFIADSLTEQGISNQFIQVDGVTRINVFTKVNQENTEYKLVNRGPQIPLEQQELLLQQFKELKENDYLIVSGSSPRGVDSSIYLQIAKICSERKVHLVLDISDPIVMECLRYRPYLLKPNEDELSAWFHLESIPDKNGLISLSKELIQRGANGVLLSLGGDGGIFVDHELNVYEGNAPKGDVVNTACAGDTLLGTFVAGLLKNKPIEKVLRTSIAAGSSTAFTSGLTDFADVEALEKEINIKKCEV